jgi:cell division protein ZapA
MTSHSTVDISLQGREYRVNCAPDEREALLAAVSHVEAKMNEIARRTRGSGERLAVMTALNLAHELLSKKPDDAPEGAASDASGVSSVASVTFDNPEIGRRIESMLARMDAAMARQEILL